MPVFTDYPVSRPTSLNDILGPLQNLQQYQQAKQLNPLQLQKAELELQRAQQLNPLEIRKAAAETKVSEETANPRIQSAKSLSEQQQTQAEKAKFDFTADQSAIAKQILGGIRNLPQVRNAGDDPESAMKTLNVAKDLMIQSGLPKENVDAHLKIIKDHVGGNAKLLPNVIDNIIGSGLNAQQQQTLQTPQLTTSGGQPAVYTPGSGQLAPAQIQQPPQPAPQPNPQGGPLPQGMALPQGMPQGIPQGLPQGAPQGVTPTQMSLQYPVRKQGDIRPFAPNEDVDTAKGVAYRNGLTTRQTDLATSRRNLDEVIAQADKIAKESYKLGPLDTSTGTLGAISRGYASVIGDPKYKQLSKDLANVQIANIQAQGGSMDTVAGQQLQKMANGDETYPPEVLKNIARRTYADVQNLDMQATAASKFAQKYGDNNLNAFKRMWSQNADSKVFEAITIFENVKDKAERNKAINDLLGSNPQARQQFYNKYNNIKKLTETGEL